MKDIEMIIAFATWRHLHSRIEELERRGVSSADIEKAFGENTKYFGFFRGLPMSPSVIPATIGDDSKNGFFTEKITGAGIDTAAAFQFFTNENEIYKISDALDKMLQAEPKNMVRVDNEEISILKRDISDLAVWYRNERHPIPLEQYTQYKKENRELDKLKKMKKDDRNVLIEKQQKSFYRLKSGMEGFDKATKDIEVMKNQDRYLKELYSSYEQLKKTDAASFLSGNYAYKDDWEFSRDYTAGSQNEEFQVFQKDLNSFCDRQRDQLGKSMQALFKQLGTIYNNEQDVLENTYAIAAHLLYKNKGAMNRSIEDCEAAAEHFALYLRDKAALEWDAFVSIFVHRESEMSDLISMNRIVSDINQYIEGKKFETLSEESESIAKQAKKEPDKEKLNAQPKTSPDTYYAVGNAMWQILDALGKKNASITGNQKILAGLLYQNRGNNDWNVQKCKDIAFRYTMALTHGGKGDELLQSAYLGNSASRFYEDFGKLVESTNSQDNDALAVSLKAVVEEIAGYVSGKTIQEILNEIGKEFVPPEGEIIAPKKEEKADAEIQPAGEEKNNAEIQPVNAKGNAAQENRQPAHSKPDEQEKIAEPNVSEILSLKLQTVEDDEDNEYDEKEKAFRKTVIEPVQGLKKDEIKNSLALGEEDRNTALEKIALPFLHMARFYSLMVEVREDFRRNYRVAYGEAQKKGAAAEKAFDLEFRTKMLLKQSAFDSLDENEIKKILAFAMRLEELGNNKKWEELNEAEREAILSEFKKEYPDEWKKNNENFFSGLKHVPEELFAVRLIDSSNVYLSMLDNPGLQEGMPENPEFNNDAGISDAGVRAELYWIYKALNPYLNEMGVEFVYVDETAVENKKLFTKTLMGEVSEIYTEDFQEDFMQRIFAVFGDNTLKNPNDFLEKFNTVFGNKGILERLNIPENGAPDFKNAVECCMPFIKNLVSEGCMDVLKHKITYNMDKPKANTGAESMAKYVMELSQKHLGSEDDENKYRENLSKITEIRDRLKMHADHTFKDSNQYKKLLEDMDALVDRIKRGKNLNADVRKQGISSALREVSRDIDAYVRHRIRYGVNNTSDYNKMMTVEKLATFIASHSCKEDYHYTRFDEPDPAFRSNYMYKTYLNVISGQPIEHQYFIPGEGVVNKTSICTALHKMVNNKDMIAQAFSEKGNPVNRKVVASLEQQLEKYSQMYRDKNRDVNRDVNPEIQKPKEQAEEKQVNQKPVIQDEKNMMDDINLIQDDDQSQDESQSIDSADLILS